MPHLIWDLDGTLIDSSGEVITCLELAIRKSPLELSKQTHQFIVGPTIDVILKKAFPSECLTEDVVKKVILNFRNIYDNSEFKMTKPFPDIERIIGDTSFVHHIVTNKPDLPTKRILEKLGWTTYITTIATPYTGAIDIKKLPLKSKSELFANLIAANGEKSLFIGIGDMITDCIAAKDNQIPAIGALWGSGTREELSDCCDYLFDDVIQLSDFLHKTK
jgi:phosphoglycolate phosphatase